MERRRRRRLVLGIASLVGLGACVIAACDPDTTRVGPGGECFVATDCEPGLVCVPQQSGARICSSDLSRVAGRPPPEGGARDAAEAGEGGEDGDVPDAPGSDAPEDTGSDTGPKDSGADG